MTVHVNVANVENLLAIDKAIFIIIVPLNITQVKSWQIVMSRFTEKAANYQTEKNKKYDKTSNIGNIFREIYNGCFNWIYKYTNQVKSINT